jgi:ribosomal protein L11 methyltransferase
LKYIEAKIYTSKQGIEPLSTVMIKMGITDFVIDDPAEIDELLSKKNTYDWDYVDKSVLDAIGNEPSITIYLEDNDAGKKTLAQIKIAMLELKSSEMYGDFGEAVALGRLYVESNIVDESNWKDTWKEFFKPSKVTDRIVIKPTWEEYEKKQGELVIEIDPGMAFGTGAHPTTVMCMKLMESHSGQFNSVLDVGCGSGILSIAAALLGANNVLGVDIDPIAVEATEKNVELNGFSNIVQFCESDFARGIEFKADLVVGNLVAELVVLLAENLNKILNPDGLFISSGILTEKLQKTRTGIEKAGFEIIDILEEDGWCAILARFTS